MNTAPPSRREIAEQAATWATRLANGRMPENQRRQFEAWLHADPAHEVALCEILDAWDSVERYAATADVMTLREAALSFARRQLNRRTGSVARRRRVIGFAAAGVMALAAVLMAAWWRLAPDIHETGVGERQVVVLADGSRLSLDADSLVTVNYSRERRRLALKRGRARFEVVRNPLRPFSVSAADELVVATGTAFSVELLRKQVRVVLYEGRVVVLDRDGRGARRTVAVGRRAVPADQLLTPGRELILPAQPPAQSAGVAAVVTRADPIRSLSWEAGLLVFEDESLDTVVERMNRYATRPLRIGDEEAAALRISGVFRAGDTDALIQGLAAAFDVRVRNEPQAIVVFKGPESKAAN